MIFLTIASRPYLEFLLFFDGASRNQSISRILSSILIVSVFCLASVLCARLINNKIMINHILLT